MKDRGFQTAKDNKIADYDLEIVTDNNHVILPSVRYNPETPAFAEVIAVK